MTINFYNLKEQFEDQKVEITEAINNVAVNGQYFAEQAVSKFENLVSRLYNGASVVATNSGTSALTVAIKAARLPAGSFVAIPAMTYIATASAVMAAGHHPVLIDIDQHWLMSYDHLERYLEQYTLAAVVLVDLYGQGVDLSRFKKLCDHYNTKIIVDAAQSFELYYDYYHQIDYCDSLALSFNPLKNLGAMGNAGAVVSKYHSVTDLYSWCVHNKVNNDVVEAGFNCRIDAIQAAILNVKYQNFDDAMRRKSEISWFYRQQLELLVPMPERNYTCTHMNYVFPIAPLNADKVRAGLEEHNIQYASHYIKPLNHYSIFKEFRDYCPAVSELEGRCISIPNHWHLSDSQVDKIVQLLRSLV